MTHLHDPFFLSTLSLQPMSAERRRHPTATSLIVVDPSQLISDPFHHSISEPISHPHPFAVAVVRRNRHPTTTTIPL